MKWIPLTVLVIASPATAADKFHVTEAEQAACGADAISLCSMALGDEDKLLFCMKTNRTSLTSHCKVTFEAGLRRRGLQ